MIRKKLTESAEQVFGVSPAALAEYTARQEMLLALINKKMLQRSDILELIGGKKNIEMMQDNHANHLRFIASVLATPDIDTLVDVILWVFRAYKSRGFHSNYWAAQINAWIAILKETLSPEAFREIRRIYEWMGANLPLFDALAQEP